MNQFDYARSYRCTASPGCPNPASIFYDNENYKRFLICKIHRVPQAKRMDSNLKRMLKKVPDGYEEVIETLRNKSYYAQAMHIASGLNQASQNIMKEIYKISGIDNYMFKELRLFHYYRKLAFFQSPNINTLKDHVKTFFIVFDLTIILKMFKLLFYEALMDRKIHDYIHFVFEYIITYASASSVRKKEIAKNRMLSEESMKLAYAKVDGNKRILHGWNMFRLFEMIRQPYIIHFLSNDCQEEWENRIENLNKYLRHKISDYPFFESSGFYREIGNSLAVLGELRRAILYLTKAMEYKGFHICIFKEIGILYYDVGLYQRAVDFIIKYMKAIRNGPNDPTSIYYISLCYIQLNQAEYASRCLSELGDSLNEYCIKEIRILQLIKTGNYMSAFDLIEELHNSFSDLDYIFIEAVFTRMIPYFWIRRYKNLVCKALCLYFKGEYSAGDQTISECYKSAVTWFGTDYPIIAEILNCWAMINQKLKKFDDAISCLVHARVIGERCYTLSSPVCIETSLLYASVYIELDNLEDAEKIILEVEEILSGTDKDWNLVSDVIFLKGKLNLRKNQMEKAYNCFVNLREIRFKLCGKNSIHFARTLILIASTRIDDLALVQLLSSFFFKTMKNCCEYFPLPLLFEGLSVHCKALEYQNLVDKAKQLKMKFVEILKKKYPIETIYHNYNAVFY